MKRMSLINICLFVLFFLLMYGYPVYAFLPLQGKVIVVDAGHGGVDPGAIYEDTYEKDIALSISKYLSDYLSSMGASVIMTRNGDSDLSGGTTDHRKKADFDKRIKIINEDYVDMYLSIHLNYLSDSRYYGPQVFYNKNNEKLALSIQDYLNDYIGGERVIKKIPASTYMYDKLNKRGVLVECGFLSNKEERDKLLTKEYQSGFAKILAEAVARYYN